MNAIQETSKLPQMSSRQIALYTSKTHKNVKRDIESMLNNLGEDKLNFERIYSDTMNRNQSEYVLDQRHTFCLIAKYNDKVRMRIIDRWLGLDNHHPVVRADLQDMERRLKENLEESQALMAELRSMTPNHVKIDCDSFSKGGELSLDDLRSTRSPAQRPHGHSGTKGVNKHVSSSGKVSWHTMIGYNGKSHFLGYFDTYEEARSARLEAERRLGVKRN